MVMKLFNSRQEILHLFICVVCTQGSFLKPGSYSKNGDVVLGGLFPLHYGAHRTDNYSLKIKPSPLVCQAYNFLGFRWMQSMLFAVEEINNRSDMLSNITLGWQIFDSCNSHHRAVSQALYMVDSLEDSMHSNISGISVSAVVGPTASDKSIAVSSILSVFDLPQISYGSTSSILAKKDIYNSFFRTIPNDNEQAVAIVELLKHHGWTWIGAVAADNDYGRPGITRLKELASNYSICIGYTAYLRTTMSPDELLRIAKEIKTFNATVFVAFTGADPLKQLAKYLEQENVTGKTWIASEAWASSRTVQAAGPTVFAGTLGIATRGGAMPGFRDFLKSVTPSSQPGSPFIKEFWEISFNCSCPSTVCEPSDHDIENHTHRSEPCTGQEDLTKADAGFKAYLGWKDHELEKTYNVYLAVYVLAQALQDIINCSPGKGLMKGGACPSIDTLESWQLLAYIKQVNFDPPGSENEFRFDQNGDPNASYKLISWKPLHTGGYEAFCVGNYSISSSPKWSIDGKAVFWPNGSMEVPASVCSQPCQPGFYQQKLQSSCCFVCLLCPPGQYSTTINANSCAMCNATDRENANHTACIPKLEEYVRWTDAFGIVFVCLSSLGVVVTMFACASFYRKQRTPLVKATNRELSFFLFFAITFCFITPFFYVTKPQDWSCKARNVCFILSFTFSIGAILVKTLRVLTAFNAKVPVIYKKRARWLGEHYQLALVLSVSLVQVVLCVVWLVVSPPYVHRMQSKASADTLIVECRFGSNALMGVVYGYLCLLALVAFIMAFQARKLPENFNEAKFVTFAMLIFVIVWVSFIPAYLTTSGVSSTAVYCIAILASTYGFLGCIFFPKLYVIYFTPSRNSIKHVRMSTVSHALRSSKSVIHRVNGQTTEADSEFCRSVASSSPYLPSKPGGCAAHVRNKKGNSNSQQFGSENFAKQQERSRRRYVQHQAPTSKDNSGSLEKHVASPTICNEASSNEIERHDSHSSSADSKTSEIQGEKDAGDDSATIEFGIAGKISSVSASDSSATFSKIMQKSSETQSASIDLKVDVKVKIQSGSSSLDLLEQEPPPNYEVSMASNQQQDREILAGKNVIAESDHCENENLNEEANTSNIWSPSTSSISSSDVLLNRTDILLERSNGEDPGLLIESCSEATDS